MINKTHFKENSVIISSYSSSDDIVSKKLPVFYNKVMKFNRDISVLLIDAIENKNLNIADPMAGSGIRSIRFLKELKKDKIRSISINDYSDNAIKNIKKNLKLNNIRQTDKIKISNNDANIFLLNSFGFDYIDIDPFGSPNFLLDSAINRISRNGILAVTATDTSALSGTYKDAGLRKYWAKTLRNEHKHELGIRILIRKCQLIAAQYEKALTPILSFSKDHYFRIFFNVEKGKTKVNQIQKYHEYYHYCNTCTDYFISDNNKEICCKKQTQTAGPLWSKKINNRSLLKKIININKQETDQKFIETLFEESKISSPFFYDLHAIAKKHKLSIPKTDILMQKLKIKKYKVSRTHFLDTAIKSDIKLQELINLMKS